jgi:ribosomal protein S18 acetylase RimI-like enzyme
MTFCAGGAVAYASSSVTSQQISFTTRFGQRGDAATIAALSTQVFLDTYATEGVRPDLAREALREYSEAAFLERLSQPERRFILSEMGDGLVGFAELTCRSLDSPVDGVVGMELVRLYVQPRAQRAGLGSALLREAEGIALAAAAPALWLTVWERNASAIALYNRVGFADVGSATYTFEGRHYGNRVFAKRLSGD